MRHDPLTLALAVHLDHRELALVPKNQVLRRDREVRARQPLAPFDFPMELVV